RAAGGRGVAGVRKGWHPKVEKKALVPGKKEIKPLILKPPRVEHRAAAKALPQDTDVATGDRSPHVRVEHHRHECQDHQVDHDTREMALSEPPPPGAPRRRDPLPT